MAPEQRKLSAQERNEPRLDELPRKSPLIQCFALDLEQPEDVAPLTVRDLVAESVPDELVQRRVLRAKEPPTT